MNADFWLSKWQKNEIGFHLPKPHPWLVATWPQFMNVANGCVFVPLCGKSLDIDFLLEQGHQVIGNELSEAAVQAVFTRLKRQPIISQWEGGACYSAENLTIYVGDFFTLSHEQIKNVELIYDRAAIIALPKNIRAEYAAHLKWLCPDAMQCLITLEYDQTVMNGPPFSVDKIEVESHYKNAYLIEIKIKEDIIEHEAKFQKNGLPELIQCLYCLTPNSKPYGN